MIKKEFNRKPFEIGESLAVTIPFRIVEQYNLQKKKKYSFTICIKEADQNE